MTYSIGKQEVRAKFDRTKHSRRRRTDLPCLYNLIPIISDTDHSHGELRRPSPPCGRRKTNLRNRTQITLEDVANEINPVLRGWIEYYGRYSPSALYPCSATSTARWWYGLCERTNALVVTGHGRASSSRPSRGRPRISSRIGGKVLSARSPDGSRVRRESHARFCERPEVKFLRPTHHETFNVLKTEGYNLEHNFGHGGQNPRPCRSP